MRDFIYSRHSGSDVRGELADVVDLYTELRSDDLLHSDEIFSLPNFVERTEKQMGEPGFELTVARLDNALVGFSFGYPFGSGKWWADSDVPSPEIDRAAKFAVIELDVHKAHQRQGVGRRLLGNLLANRHEQFATLACMPGSPPQAMYERWGWQQVGVIGGDGPLMAAMLLQLSPELA